MNMKKFAVAISLVISLFLTSQAQEPLSYFLPEDVTYNKNIPTPDEFFNQQMGEWHLKHEQILNYIKEIARESDRAVLQEYARTYENRQLVHLIFTSAENQKKLEALKQLHNNFTEPGSDISPEEVPLVVTMGYSVHGNESSAGNSSVLTAYYLAAAEGEKIDLLLENTIILVDPVMNPDGFTRHSTWANMHQSAVNVGDSNSRQFNEVWPGGRTNHYWFDLNRDYLLLVHPESRGRVKKLHEWKPNIFTDHHEMGANSTFFFQPGVPSRNNPLTPEKNYDLTHEIAKYHARFLDEIGSYYFTEEQFDDYYFGKGSSYPDVNGSIGILFEQAGFRGRFRETSNGVKKFSFGIKNQFTVTLSTLEAAFNLKNELLSFQKNFYREALELAEKDPVKAYIFGSSNDRVKTNEFIRLLNQHQIKVFKNENEFSGSGRTFLPGTSFVAPVKQTQYRLIKSIFEEVSAFADSTFYDVSTWTFPYAYNIPFAKVNSLKNIEYSEEPVEAYTVEGSVIGDESSIAYLFRWDEFSTPEALYSLQKAGLRTKVANVEFEFSIDGKNEKFTYGTILVPVSDQQLSQHQIYQLVSKVAQKTGVDFYSLETGLSPSGIDGGSNGFDLLKKPEILILAGDGVSSRDAGEIWHLFDQRYKIPVTLSESSDVGRMNLNRYNAIILPGGSYGEMSNREIQKIKDWTQNGGTLIAYKSAAGWVARNGLGKTDFKNEIEPDSTRFLAYANRNKERIENAISGAIFNTNADITHPLCYGYSSAEIPVFKTGNSVAKPLGEKYAEPVKFSAEPYISGYVSQKNIEQLRNAPVVSVQKVGSGKLISYYENMTFRGTWLGTNKLFSNAVFFGNIIR
jgi:hypothetical protein